MDTEPTGLPVLDLEQFFETFQDYLAPTLDTYEQAIYLYCFRHSRLVNLNEIVIGFKSARSEIATGSGTAGRPMSEKSVYAKLRSLDAKGCIRLLGSEHSGTRLSVFLPSEMPGLVPPASEPQPVDLESVDFFKSHRQAILQREGRKCFYCLRELNADNFLIEHIVSRPEGDNSYRNVVAACRSCNNRKSDSPADSFIRVLYREGFLSDGEFAERISQLKNFKMGFSNPAFTHTPPNPPLQADEGRQRSCVDQPSVYPAL